jgi:uncharacterized protein with von Willebrand factor type A (vWA) domain
MPISGIHNTPYIPQISSLGNSGQVNAAGGDNDGDGSKKSGTLASAIDKSLSQSGIPSSGADQALQAFLQNLLAALQAQGQDADSDRDSDQSGKSTANAVSGRHQGTGIGKMEAGLHILIQQLSTNSGNSADAALQQSFQSLIGSSCSNATLTGFLQTLSQNLQGAGMTGNNVNTQG